MSILWRPFLKFFSPFLGHFCSCSRVLGSDTSMLGLGFLVLVADLCCLFYFGNFVGRSGWGFQYGVFCILLILGFQLS